MNKYILENEFQLLGSIEQQCRRQKILLRVEVYNERDQWLATRSKEGITKSYEYCLNIESNESLCMSENAGEGLRRSDV